MDGDRLLSSGSVKMMADDGFLVLTTERTEKLRDVFSAPLILCGEKNYGARRRPQLFVKGHGSKWALTGQAAVVL